MRTSSRRLAIGGDRIVALAADPIEEVATDESPYGYSYTTFLPGLLNLEGKPFSLEGREPFKFMFDTIVAPETVVMAARQVSKSMSGAARAVLDAAHIPNWKLLSVFPLFEMARRYSSNYVKPLIEKSPIRTILHDASISNNVLQKSFRNGSILYFLYAESSADRARGLSVRKIHVDECQLVSSEILPILGEAMSASVDGDCWLFTGTPLTTDLLIEKKWQRSSQAEWVIRCGCGYWNIPALEHDLEKMLGPYRDDISMEKPGTICARCGQSIHPSRGEWIHRYPSRRWNIDGRHLPQPLISLHYALPHKWLALLGKQAGKGFFTQAKFTNEILAESYDVGARLITETDLRRAGTLGPLGLDTAKKYLGGYIMTALGADWGGGGDEELSWTCLAAAGMRADGTIDVFWGIRSKTPLDSAREAALVIKAMKEFRTQYLAHDLNNAAHTREQMILRMGWPANRVMPITYSTTPRNKALVWKKPNIVTGSRGYFAANKTRCLLSLFEEIKTGRVRTFGYDYVDEDRPGLLHDFLGITEVRRPTIGPDSIGLVRDETRTDDFAHSVMYACLALWQLTGRWPDLHKSVSSAMEDEVGIGLVEASDESLGM